jgi:hypothetical protein
MTVLLSRLTETPGVEAATAAVLNATAMADARSVPNFISCPFYFSPLWRDGSAIDETYHGGERRQWFFRSFRIHWRDRWPQRSAATLIQNQRLWEKNNSTRRGRWPNYCWQAPATEVLGVAKRMHSQLFRHNIPMVWQRDRLASRWTTMPGKKQGRAPSRVDGLKRAGVATYLAFPRHARVGRMGLAGWHRYLPPRTPGRPKPATRQPKSHSALCRREGDVLSAR